MTKYFTEDFNNLQDWRKVEELLTQLQVVYVRALAADKIDDADSSDIDIAISTISDYRSKL